MQDEELLTAQELAGRTKASVSGVRKWTAQGMPHQAVGRLKRYRLREALAWLQSRALRKEGR